MNLTRVLDGPTRVTLKIGRSLTEFAQITRMGLTAGHLSPISALLFNINLQFG